MPRYIEALTFIILMLQMNVSVSNAIFSRFLQTFYQRKVFIW